MVIMSASAGFAMRFSALDGWYIRRPTASPFGQKRLASVSSITSTRGRPSMSLASISRPLSSLTPIASK